METIKPKHFSRSRAALLATACMMIPLHAGESRGSENLASSEQARRSANIEEAQVLLKNGDAAYQSGRYQEASEAYAGARDLIPNAPVSAALRDATTERYAQASVEYARLLSRKGDVAGAKAAMDKVLRPSVAPNNPEALNFRAQLDDPIRTNPALTKEVAKEIDSVRRLLYTAEGAYNLGKFDEAKNYYEEVLRIDSTNSAARRGMEKVAQAKTTYQKAAYDQTRAEMLSQVDGAWETQIHAPALNNSLIDPGANTESANSIIYISAKLKQIIIPKLSLDQVSLEEALDFLRLRARENDTLELDPDKKGINFTVNLGPPNSPVAEEIRKIRFNLQLTQVPVSQALKYITEATKTAYTTDDFAVIITPVGVASEELVSRSYHVPPDFLSNISNSQSATTDTSTDPFATKQPSEGLLAKRMGVQEALTQQGVHFPDGASASYIAKTNTLRVINTNLNQDFISRIVENVTQTEPVMIKLSVTMISVQQTRLEELGFDWLLNPVALDNSGNVFASGGTVGNTGGRTGGDLITPVNGTAVNGIPLNSTATVSDGLLTNGNRSGATAINGNSIDGLINNPDRGTQQTSVAPGILALTGLFNNTQIQMVMRGLNQKKGVDLMAKPSVTTRSGQQSSVKVIREFIYPTEYEPPELPNSVGSNGGSGGTFPVTPATPTAFQKRDVGIQLDVLPVADADKQYIDVTLNPSFIDFDGFVNYGSPINTTTIGLLGQSQVTTLTPNRILMPIFSKQAVSTNIRIADGATIAIGGLLKEETQIVEDKTPVLGDLPIIGRLFKSTSKQPVSTAIVFLVNVELMDPTGRPYRRK